MKLHTKVQHIDHWTELKEGEYLFLYEGDVPRYIVFKCPGCGESLSINNLSDRPRWEINFETLTATPSILHKRDGRGCGWHGYLTNGELKGQIE